VKVELDESWTTDESGPKVKPFDGCLHRSADGRKKKKLVGKQLQGLENSK